MNAMSLVRVTRGFALMEILVALLVLSIGLLGLAGLQTVGLRSTHSSYARSQATLLAYDMADRIRANSIGATAGEYLIAHGDDAPAAAEDLCVAAICSAAEMADYDLNRWISALEDILPAGDGEVTGTAPDFTITVRWDETRSGATGTGCGMDVAADLRCFRLSVSL